MRLCCACICLCAIFLLSILAKHTRAKRLSKGSLWRQRTRAQLLLLLTHSHSVSRREIFRISYRSAIIIQNVCMYSTYIHTYVRAEVLSLHQAHQGDTVCVTAAAAVEIVNGNLDEFYPASCHWNSLTQGITGNINIIYPSGWYKWPSAILLYDSQIWGFKISKFVNTY